jgi:hypothetical protein
MTALLSNTATFATCHQKTFFASTLVFTKDDIMCAIGLIQATSHLNDEDAGWARSGVSTLEGDVSRLEPTRPSESIEMSEDHRNRD